MVGALCAVVSFTYPPLAIVLCSVGSGLFTGVGVWAGLKVKSRWDKPPPAILG